MPRSSLPLLLALLLAGEAAHASRWWDALCGLRLWKGGPIAMPGPITVPDPLPAPLDLRAIGFRAPPSTLFTAAQWRTVLHGVADLPGDEVAQLAGIYELPAVDHSFATVEEVARHFRLPKLLHARHFLGTATPMPGRGIYVVHRPTDYDSRLQRRAVGLPLLIEAFEPARLSSGGGWAVPVLVARYGADYVLFDDFVQAMRYARAAKARAVRAVLQAGLSQDNPDVWPLVLALHSDREPLKAVLAELQRRLALAAEAL